MDKRYSIQVIVLIFIICIMGTVSAVPEDLPNPIFHPTNFSNIVVNASVNHSNSTDYWITDEGTAGTVNGTWFDIIGDVLTIDQSFIDGLWCALTGCTMEGDIDMDNNNIDNVENLTVYGSLGIYNSAAPPSPAKLFVESPDEEISIFKKNGNGNPHGHLSLHSETSGGGSADRGHLFWGTEFSASPSSAGYIGLGVNNGTSVEDGLRINSTLDATFSSNLYVNGNTTSPYYFGNGSQLDISTGDLIDDGTYRLSTNNTFVVPSNDYGIIITDGTIDLRTYFDTSAWIGSFSNSALKFFINGGAAALNIDTNERVGIGIGSTTPANILTVRPQASDDGILVTESDSNTRKAALLSSTASGGGLDLFTNNNIFHTHIEGTAGRVSNWIGWSNGNTFKLSIGKDVTPEALLDVGGGTATYIDGTDDLLVKDDAEIDGDLYVSGNTSTTCITINGEEICNFTESIEASSFWKNDSGVINTTTTEEYHVQSNLSVGDNASIEGCFFVSDFAHFGNNVTVMGTGNFTGELYASSFIVTEGDSIFFGNSSIDFIARMSAQRISVLGFTRNVLSTDATTFGSVVNYNGTSLIGTGNFNDGVNSSSVVSAGNNLGSTASILKFSSNHSSPNKAYFGTSVGNLMFLGGNDDNDNISIGFSDGAISSILGDISGFNNETDVIKINNKNWETPFLTTFNFPVNFNNDTVMDNLNITNNLNVGGNITLGQKITFAFGEMIDNIVDGIIKITGSLLVDGDINQTNGNAFINNIYGYAKMKNETGVVIDLVTQGVYENITGINNGSTLSGVTYDGDHAFIINYSGTYEVSASIAFAGASATDYFFDVLINGVTQDIFSQRQITTSNAEGSASLGPYGIYLNEGDMVTLGVADGATPVNPTMIGVQFGIRRVGE